jgi:integrase
MIPEGTQIRQVKYLNNIVEQDHRIIKKRVRSMLGFESYETVTSIIKAGVNVKVVSDRLGHSRVQITLEYYTRIDDEVQRSTSEMLAKFLHGA